MTDPNPATPEPLPARPLYDRLAGPIFAALVGVLVLIHTYLAVVDIQTQFKRVEVMEQSRSLYQDDYTRRFDENPAVASFAKDPVFSTPQWQAVLDENRKAMSGTGLLEPKNIGIWVPGLEQRAAAALPSVYDHDEFVMAASTSMITCRDKALTVDQRVLQWRESYERAAYQEPKNDPYLQAKLAAMPDVIRAGTAYFCGDEQVGKDPQ